jgi:hypothetical protein
MFLTCLCAPACCTATVARAKPLQREPSVTPVLTLTNVMQRGYVSPHQNMPNQYGVTKETPLHSILPRLLIGYSCLPRQNRGGAFPGNWGEMPLLPLSVSLQLSVTTHAYPFYILLFLPTSLPNQYDATNWVQLVPKRVLRQGLLTESRACKAGNRRNPNPPIGAKTGIVSGFASRLKRTQGCNLRNHNP